MDELDQNRGPSWALCVFLTLAFYLSGFFVILTPLPLVYAFFRYQSSGVLKVVLPCLIALTALYRGGLSHLHAFFTQNPNWSWLIMPPGINLLDTLSINAASIFGLGYYLFFVGVAYLAYYLLSKATRPFLGLGLATLGFFTVVALLYSAYTYWAGSSPFEFTRQYFDHLFQELITLQESQNAPPEQLGFIKDNRGKMLDYAVYLAPSFLFGFILLILLVNLALGKKFLTPLIPQIREIRFSYWSCPFFGVWLVIGSISLALANAYLAHWQPLLFAALNLLLILSLVYYLQGLCILAFFLDRWGVRPFAKALIYLSILLFFQPFGFVLVGVGFFDSWFDFRKLTPPDPKPSFGG